MARQTTAELAQQLQEQLITLQAEFDVSKKELQYYELQQLRERLVVLEFQVAELKRSKEESEKRHWQFVYIFSGGMVTLFVSLLVQLIVSMIRK